MRWSIAILLVLVGVAGCALPAANEPTRTREASATASPSGTPVDETDDSAGEIPEELLGDILIDASERSGITPNDLEILTAEAASWNDGSLGCPEPGQMYTQALVDGFHVVIRAAEEELDYRVGNGGFRLCENPTAPVDGTKPSG